MSRSKSFRVLIGFFAVASLTWAQKSELVSVISKAVSRSVDLPAEVQPFLSVSLHARVPGYVEQVAVDRGSIVKQGELLVQLSAPEMASRIAEMEAKIQAIASDQVQAEAQLAATRSTYEGMKKAAETPGAIAGNELVQLQQQMEAGQALIQSRRQSSQAAGAELRALQEMQSYLRIAAPFDGVVTDRLVHPGALVGPGADSPLLMLQQISKLRVVVAVPEEDCGTVSQGARVTFRVPAFPERTYSGTIARSAHALDPKTRTMAVELDVTNADGSLSPGMYPTVRWPVRRSRPALLVPVSSVVTTTERTFVIRDRDGHAEWIDVKRGPADGELIEVMGALRAGDKIVARASDEIREGSPLPAK
jgi:membrane fusion protein, multidrug efflux system